LRLATRHPDRVEKMVVMGSMGVPFEITDGLDNVCGASSDFNVDTGAGTRHAGAGFVLTIGADRYQVETDGWARDVPAGSRVAVTGRLEIVGDYEWDAFGLSESRVDWLVKAIAGADHGDTMLDLGAPWDV
jgi:pimeloyl-ACP methyl ester carboxylesterase